MSNAEKMGSITEATGSLVEILDGFDQAGKSSNQASSTYTDDFSFANKDLILYALGGKLDFEAHSSSPFC